MSAALKTGADARAMRNTKFDPEFSKKVDMTKVNLPVIKKWVSDEIARILNSDDDVVTEMLFTLLEAGKYPNIKQIQTDISGFLDKDAAPFCRQLWKLLLSAQADPKGIPQELLEAKKFELIQERIAEDRAREEARQREIEDRERERELTRIRERERGSRGRGGGRGGRGRGRDRSFERRPSRDSRSPPPRRRSPPRATDSYVPGGRGRGGRDDNPRRRRRSPSYGRSPARSRSPPARRRRRNSDADASRSPPRKREGDNEERRHRRRSPSPRRRRRSPSTSDDSRSPPSRRRRRSSPSRSPPRRRSRSHSPPSKRKGRLSPPADLMASKDRAKHDNRLSREGSSYSDAPGKGRRGSMSSESMASGGAKNEVGNDD
ncbi:Putative PWI domain-containing protein [Septoria linicola]|uniref:PWI domain-containing protein n=1 Tax=Septoria linicola TaxID=215465 RepID=A0A9Q9AYZ9_9PEZI|nr:Putative PWI domain-containing protein [Septoria linicola]